MGGLNATDDSDKDVDACEGVSNSIFKVGQALMKLFNNYLVLRELPAFSISGAAMSLPVTAFPFMVDLIHKLAETETAIATKRGHEISCRSNKDCQSAKAWIGAGKPREAFIKKNAWAKADDDYRYAY